MSKKYYELRMVDILERLEYNALFYILSSCGYDKFSWAMYDFRGISVPPGMFSDWDEFYYKTKGIYIYDDAKSFFSWVKNINAIYDGIFIGSTEKLTNAKINNFIEMHSVIFNGNAIFSQLYGELCAFCDVCIHCIDGGALEIVDCKSVLDPQILPSIVRKALVEVM